MLSLPLTLVRLSCLFAGLLVSYGAATAAETLQAGRLSAITERMRSDVKDGLLPGAVLSIFSHGKQVYFESVGSLDPAASTPMVGDAIFRIESMTKPMTTAAAMVLVDDGKLNLDDPIAKHLPSFADIKVLHEARDGEAKTQLVETKRSITVRDLMRHTAGLDYGWLAPRSERTRLLNATSRSFRRDLNNEELAHWLSQVPLAAQPGTVWNYSSATDVLGRLVEVVSGKPLGGFLKERIFDPLDMRDTAFYVTQPDKARRIAEPFANERAGMSDPRLVRRLESGGQGLNSTARDYARFLQMLLNGGELDGKRVLRRESAGQMTSDQLGEGISRGPHYSPGTAYGFGLGFAVRTVGKEASPGGELGDYWWGGGAGTYAWVDPVNQLVVVFMTQSRVQRMPYRLLLRSMVYDAVR
jgi:CubicO group peptidase (beta-lactamase class C family)